MDRARIDAAINRYLADATTPARAIAGLSREDLLAFPIPGTWSIQQIIMHLMDSDLIASDRMKRTIAEKNAQILAYDETAFATHLPYDKLDAAMACELFRLNRVMTAALLRELPDEAFDRIGQHSERGPESLIVLIEIYVNHVGHHMKFIEEKRKLLGK